MTIISDLEYTYPSPAVRMDIKDISGEALTTGPNCFKNGKFPGKSLGLQKPSETLFMFP